MPADVWFAEIIATLQDRIKYAEEGLSKAVERNDYANATQANSYLLGLTTSLGVLLEANKTT